MDREESRATFKNLISVDDVMYSRMIAHPFRVADVL